MNACACTSRAPCLAHYGQLPEHERLAWRQALGITTRKDPKPESRGRGKPMIHDQDALADVFDQRGRL